MNNLQQPPAAVKNTGAAWAALERWMTERGTYDAQARADVKTQIDSTGELPTQLIAPDDVIQAQAIWQAASWFAERASADDEGDLSSWRPMRVRAVLLERVRDELLPLYEPPLRSQKTRAEIRHCFKVLAELGARTSGDLDETLVAKLIKSRDPALSCRTVAGLLRTLRIVGNFCKRKGYIRETPFAFRKVGDWVRITPVEHRRYYTSDEVRAILSTMEADVRASTGWEQWRARRLWAVTACCAYGGFRMSEAFRLFVEDLDFECGIIMVSPRTFLKTIGAARLVPMPPRLRKILEEEWLPFRQSAPPGFLDEEALRCPYLFPGATRKSYWHDGPTSQKPLARLKSVAHRAGIADYGDATFSKFRHAWATQAEFLGIPGAGIQRIMGHTTELTSLRNYRHSVALNLVQTVSGFDY